MAEAMIDAALQTLSSLIQNELFSFLGFHSEMRRLSSLLTTIKAVLEDAEEKQITDKALNNWLRKLRDEAHLLDDVLDECSTHALSLEYQNKVQGCCFSSFNPTHVMFRYKMAKRLKDISERLDEIAEERSKFHLHERSHEERRDRVIEWRETSSNISQPHFYGRDLEKQKIVEVLVGDACDLEDLTVYAIVGIGGLGKTTLAQQVFNDKMVVDHFEHRIWVCVSDDFNLSRLLKAVIESATMQPCGDLEQEPLQRKLKEVLGGKRYLLVLDDVWNDNKIKWDKLKSVLAYGSTGASILLTTRQNNVANITTTMEPLHLSLLSEDDCWQLFKNQAFVPPNEERAELMNIGKEIIKKCKGVPLAAKTLGSLLCSSNNEEDWNHIKNSEIWNLPQEKQEEPIMPALRLSYLNLSTKTRQCFAYLAVFPKDEVMIKKHVIELWMANGLISTIEGRDVEYDGDAVWNELYSKSFFEDAHGEFCRWSGYDGDPKFKMHDLLHDLAHIVMEKECCSKTSESGPPGERTRHLSIDRGGLVDEHWSSHFSNLKSLKSFIVLPFWNDEPITSNIFLNCTSLRVLEIRLLKEVPCTINQLKHLRFLNLSKGHFTTLPDSICKLWNLLILNLNRCESLQTLPNQLKCLKALRHLHLEYCWSLSSMAHEMGQLTRLKTLHTYIVGLVKGFLLEEIGNLKLEGTLHIQHLERLTSGMDAKRANLAEKRLNKLKLSWEGGEQTRSQESEEEILEVLQPHKQLKTLVIRGYIGAHLPQWMVNPMLNDLSHLELGTCRNVVDISFLAKLPSLKGLELSGMDKVQYIDDDCYVEGVERGFQALEHLTLWFLTKLVKLSREDGGNMFPRLSTLSITTCPQLQQFPFLPSVTKLEVSRCLSRVLLGSIQNLPNLESIAISDDIELTSFPDDMLGGLKNLKILSIRFFPKLEALPSELANFNVLEDLHIMDCDSLDTITEEVLRGLRSLKKFTIQKIPKFILCASFRHLIALEDLTIQACPEVEDLHAGLQHLTSLKGISLVDLPNLTSLPHCLANLSSLEQLHINDCPKLTSLPTSIQSLSNLKLLHIWACPELGKKCQEGTGEDWHKISHVPHRDIRGSY